MTAPSHISLRSQKLTAYGVLTLLVFACQARAETNPTGKSQRLFSEQSFRVPDNWRTATLQTGRTFHLGVYYESFRSIIETKEGPKP